MTGTGPHRREQGFTLVEIILVLVVMCLVAALTLPAMMRSRSAFHLRTVARDVIGSVRFARDTAVTEQKVMVLQIDSQAEQVIVSDDVGDGPHILNMPNDIKIQGVPQTRNGSTAAAGARNEQPWRIRFLPNGSADFAEISLTADSGATLKIATDPITGSARVVNDTGAKAP